MERGVSAVSPGEPRRAERPRQRAERASLIAHASARLGVEVSTMTTHAATGHPRMAHQVRAVSRTNERELAGLCFLAIGAAFLTTTMLLASMAPSYDYAGGAISDLGVIPETALLFNGLLVLVGVLNGGAGIMLYRLGASPWLLAVYLVAQIGAIGAGVIPLDRGGLHSLFALLAFVFFNLEAVVTGGVIRGPVRLLGILAGGVGLAYAVIMLIGDGGNAGVFGAIGHGGAERMIVFPTMLWLIAAGGYLLGQRSEPAAG
jgi:hypothetical membrane protein